MSTLMEEDNGNKSSMRFMCLLSLLTAIAWGTLTLLRPLADPSIGIYLTVIAFAGAFAPKAIQKFAEQKMPAGD